MWSVPPPAMIQTCVFSSLLYKHPSRIQEATISCLLSAIDCSSVAGSHVCWCNSIIQFVLRTRNQTARTRTPSVTTAHDWLGAVTHLGFDLVVSEAEVLQVGRRVGLDGRELVLQHLDHLRQLRIPPAKLPAERQTQAESIRPHMERVGESFHRFRRSIAPPPQGIDSFHSLDLFTMFSTVDR